MFLWRSFGFLWLFGTKIQRHHLYFLCNLSFLTCFFPVGFDYTHFFLILRLKYINADNLELSVKVVNSSSSQSTVQNACIWSNVQGLQSSRLVYETFTLTWPLRLKEIPHKKMKFLFNTSPESWLVKWSLCLKQWACWSELNRNN